MRFSLLGAASLLAIGCAAPEGEPSGEPGETSSAPLQIDAKNPWFAGALGQVKANACAAEVAVDASALQEGDGSAGNPFRTIRAALAYGEKSDACHLRVNVAPGAYAEGAGGPLEITRATSIIGTDNRPTVNGWLTISTTEPVSVSNIALDARWVDLFQTKQKLITRQTAIDVKSTKADVSLRSVQIVNAKGYGVTQDGGTLDMLGVEIARTSAVDSDLTSGAAVRVAAGTQARLRIVRFHHNVRGLYAAGASTVVTAHGMAVEDSTSHPTLGARIAAVGEGACFRGVGAVELDGATAGGTLWSIRRSLVVGLYAHHGATVSAQNVRVAATNPGGGTVRAETCGGFGVVTQLEGHVDLRNFDVSDSDVCGVVVGGAPGTGMDLHDGMIRRASVGACVQLPGFDTARLRDNVRYIDVDIPLQATSYTLPDLSF